MMVIFMQMLRIRIWVFFSFVEFHDLGFFWLMLMAYTQITVIS